VLFSKKCKRAAVQRILTGGKTLAELSRELDISPSLIRNWSGSPRQERPQRSRR
jgi:transposase-like protein